MACIVFVYLGLCFSVVHATQDCHGNDCPITVNSMLQVKGQAQIETKFAAGWYASGEWTSCTDACTNIGLTCTEAEVENHNSEIYTNTEVLDLISGVGGSTSAGNCGTMEDEWTGCPSWTATWCCKSAANRSYTGACDKAANADGKQRLCYCHEASASSEASSEWDQYLSDNTKCVSEGDGNWCYGDNCYQGTDVSFASCQAKADENGHPYIQFAIDQPSTGSNRCTTAALCDSPVTGTTWPWRIYKQAAPTVRQCLAADFNCETAVFNKPTLVELVVKGTAVCQTMSWNEDPEKATQGRFQVEIEPTTATRDGYWKSAQFTVAGEAYCFPLKNIHHLAREHDSGKFTLNFEPETLECSTARAAELMDEFNRLFPAGTLIETRKDCQEV